MYDSYGREVNYLRLSVTDLCDLRCVYCMPEEGVEKRLHEDMLRVEEMERIVRAAASLGITKVRITGGEPLVRRGIEEIVRRVSAVPGIRETCLTTNGQQLAEIAEALKACGLDRVNVSLDALNPALYEELTRGGSLKYTLEGIRAAIACGLTPVKINCVVLNGVNDGEIEKIALLTQSAHIHVRFLELMPIGESADWQADRQLKAEHVFRRIGRMNYEGETGNAQVWRIDGYPGTVSLIRPLSRSFCARCNRIRVTPDGFLKSCLHAAAEIPLRGLSDAQLIEAIKQGIAGKPRRHRLAEDGCSACSRRMVAIGG